jgi:CBS domain-containing protein
VGNFTAAGKFSRERIGPRRGDRRARPATDAAGRLHGSRAAEAVMRVYEVMSKAVETVRPAVLPKLPKALGKWTVGDLMTSPVVTVTSRTPVRRAAALMKGRSIGSLVVTSANGKVAGIVTVSDLLELLARKPERHSNRDRRARKAMDESWDE